MDPIVRQEAARDPVRIVLRTGSYVPIFEHRTPEPISEPAPPHDTSRPFRARPWIAGLAVLALIIATGLATRYFGTRQAASGPSHAEAEKVYLQGLYLWQKRTPDSLSQAVDLFTQAVVRDPNYAQAYTGLADCYLLLREFSMLPDSEAYPRGRAAAKRAMQLDDNLAEAHNTLAFIRRALAIKPNYATAHHWYATFLHSLGRFPEAATQIEIAQRLDSGSNAIHADKVLLAFRYRRAGRRASCRSQSWERPRSRGTLARGSLRRTDF